VERAGSGQGNSYYGNGLARARRYDNFTSPLILYVYTGRSGITENFRAQTNRVIGNGESESFDASRFGLSWTVAWTVLRPRFGLPPATLFHYPHDSSPFVQFVPFVCPAGVASDCQKLPQMCESDHEQKDVRRT
jgi:hypothetical protein